MYLAKKSDEWDQTSLLTSALHNIHIAMGSLAGGAQQAFTTPEDFHPFKLKEPVQGSGVKLTADNIGILKSVIGGPLAKGEI